MTSENPDFERLEAVRCTATNRRGRRRVPAPTQAALALLAERERLDELERDSPGIGR